MSDHPGDYPIASMCRILGVSPSGYYAWMKRRPSRRAVTDAVLIGEIRRHAASRGTYGAPRIHAELTAKGMRVGRKRVTRLMSQTGLAGVSRRKFVTTTAKSDSCQAPDLVERDFTASVPDRLWVADITYVPTWAGPSRTTPSGGRRKRPSLTATARDSRVSARVGTEEWLRRGPNQRMPGTGGQHDAKPESLIPSSHLSTKPGVNPPLGCRFRL